LAWASSRARIAATAAVFFAGSAFGGGALDEARRHELGGEASSTPPASCAMRTVRVRGFTVVIGSDKGGLVVVYQLGVAGVALEAAFELHHAAVECEN